MDELRKPRIKLTSKGWFRYWMTMARGSVDFRTGQYIPEFVWFKGERREIRESEIWIGPFSTALQAFEASATP